MRRTIGANPRRTMTMTTIDLDVQGMSCGGCVKHVTAALKPLPGVREVEFDLSAGRVRVHGDLAEGIDPLVSALKQAGYPAQASGAAASKAPGAGRGWVTPPTGRSSPRCGTPQGPPQITPSRLPIHRRDGSERC